MIKVEKICFRSLGRNPHETFIVKNPKKIEFWKKLEGIGFTGEIKITVLDKILIK